MVSVHYGMGGRASGGCRRPPPPSPTGVAIVRQCRQRCPGAHVIPGRTRSNQPRPSPVDRAMDASVTLPRDEYVSLAGPPPAWAREGCLDATRELGEFLKEVERRAFRIAEIALRNPDDALDVVQEAMIQLARSYADRPSEEWRPLFHRILQNCIHDWPRPP